jgi:hypothetical protein
VARVALYGAAPGNTDQFVVAQRAEMGVRRLPRLEAHDVALVVVGDEQDKVAGSGKWVGHGIWHGATIIHQGPAAWGSRWQHDTADGDELTVLKPCR